MSCGHEVPAFGCKPCIDGDKDRIIEEAKKAPSPPCPECGGKMALYEWSGEGMTLDYVCEQKTGEAYICDGEMQVKIERNPVR